MRQLFQPGAGGDFFPSLGFLGSEIKFLKSLIRIRVLFALERVKGESHGGKQPGLQVEGARHRERASDSPWVRKPSSLQVIGVQSVYLEHSGTFIFPLEWGFQSHH